MSKKITQEDKEHYQKLHEIAYNYSFEGDNNNADTLYLIKSYEGLIWKFIYEVKSPDILNIKDRKIRNFYKLYISKKEIGEKITVHNYNFIHKVRNIMNSRSNLIATLLSVISQQDLYQESIIRLLVLADRYSDEEKPSFHTYVDRVFHYEFYRVVKDNIPSNFNVFNELEIMDFDYNENYNHKPDRDNDIKEVEKQLDDTIATNDDGVISKTVFKTLFSDEYFDINWINGHTANKIFKTLNFFQRKILKLYYVDGLTDKEVGNELGFSRIVINKRRNESKKEIYRLAKEENLVDTIESDATKV